MNSYKVTHLPLDGPPKSLVGVWPSPEVAVERAFSDYLRMASHRSILITADIAVAPAVGGGLLIAMKQPIIE